MTQHLKLKIIGEQTLHCAGCERTIEFTLARLPGVRSVKADQKAQTIEISPASSEVDLEKVKAELDWIGYHVEVA
ncbi:MAG TPA: heavy metal-associated domain-containing protein [Anaerolineae bacterium]|nr:heavy metal-associated domain-containing protein [Anaerolineae bacterium]